MNVPQSTIFSSVKLWSMIRLMLACFVVIPSFGQNGNRDLNPLPSAISLPTNVPNATKYKDMIGINEVGYVFWDHVYNSTNNTVVRPTIANAFKNTFSKIRLFHDVEKDYNLNQPYKPNTPDNTTTTLPVCSSGSSRDYFCALKNFYGVLRPDYPYISSSLMAHRYTYPNAWYTAVEWGGTPANIKEEAYLYAVAYLQNMDPTPSSNPKTNLVDRVYTSNEAWGSALGVDGYKSICDGLIEGFTFYYQGSRTATPNQTLWNIKLWLGAFQAGDVTSIEANDYIGTMASTNSKNYLQGIDVHPYAFHQNAPTNNSLLLTQHPESDNSYFLSIKNLVKWRNDQTGNAANFKLSATEFGWNSSDIYKRMQYTYTPTGSSQPVTKWIMQKKNSNPAVGSTLPTTPSDWEVENYGIGEEAQALYSIRAFLMLGRYGFESGYLYGSLNNEETWFGTCGVYHTNIDTVKLVGSNSGFFEFNVTIYGGPASEQFAAPAHEKKIMPAIRKLRNASVIGDKVYMQSLIENDNGVYAYLVGSGTGNPTHLVAWYAANINNQNETQILATTLARTLTQINFPTNLAIGTTASTRLDWNEASINNITTSTVFNTATSTLTLTPIPIVIPVVVASCSNVTSAGAISGAQNICAPYDPTNMTSTTAASGGTGTLQYIWQSSNTSATATDFANIAGATAATYDPTSINFSTWYRRGARRAGCTNYLFTTAIAKTSTNVTSAGVIAANQTVCGTGGTSNNPALLTSTSGAAGGTGFAYKWQSATVAAGPYTDVSPAVTVTTYDPPAITATTHYRRVAKNSTCTVYTPSNVVTATYNATCTSTDIAVTFQEKCVLPSGNVRMKVKLDNLGTTTVNNVVVTFTGLCGGYNPSGTVVPSGSTYDPGFCPTYPQKWTINSSAAGSSYVLTLEYYLNPAAVVSASHSTSGDGNGANNSDSFTNTGLANCSTNSIDFSVVFSSKCIMSNGNVKMAVTASNLGTTALTNAVVTFTGLCNGYNPSGTNVPSGSTWDQGFCPSFPQTWTIANMTAGSTYTLVIEYWLDPNVTITASNTTTGDVVPSNNSANFVNTGLVICSNGTGVPGKPHFNADQMDLMVYPNPFNTELHFDIISPQAINAHVQLLNATGQAVLSKTESLVKGNNSIHLITDKIASGIYFISVDTGGSSRLLRKVIKVE